jgi:hypothetical protein
MFIYIRHLGNRIEPSMEETFRDEEPTDKASWENSPGTKSPKTKSPKIIRLGKKSPWKKHQGRKVQGCKCS